MIVHCAGGSDDAQAGATSGDLVAPSSTIDAKAEAALLRNQVVGVLHAREAAPDGVRKLASAIRQCDEERPASPIAVIDAFSSTQLDLALGRSNVIHAALLAGPESEAFVARAARLERFRTGGREHERISTAP